MCLAWGICQAKGEESSALASRELQGQIIRSWAAARSRERPRRVCPNDGFVFTGQRGFARVRHAYQRRVCCSFRPR